MNLRQKILKAFYPALLAWGKLTGNKSITLSNTKDTHPMQSFYNLTVQLNNGKELKLDSTRGKKVMLVDVNNSMVHVPDNKLVLLQGLEDYIVVDTKDVLLVCHKEKEQEIKDYVAEIKRNMGEKYL